MMRRRSFVYVYHPIVTKLAVSFTLLGLLLLVAMSPQGRASLDGIHASLSAELIPAICLLAILFGVSTLSPFFPEFLIPVAAGFVLGLEAGSIFSILAITVAASANFAIGRRSGRRVIERIFDRHSVEEIRWTAARVTSMMVFLTWLLPSINFDLISYASGLSRIAYRRFLMITLAGNILSSVLLAFLGEGLRSDQAIAFVATLFVYTLIGTGLYAKDLPPWIGGSPLKEREP